MYEDKFNMSRHESRDVDDILGRLHDARGMYAFNRALDEYAVDPDGQRVLRDFIVVRGSRFIVDKRGVVWRFYAKGSSKRPDSPATGGSPFRCNCVEMWSGNWRRIAVDNNYVYAKHLIPLPIDPGINEKPGISHLDWYLGQKGYKHPHDDPHDPTDYQIKVMESQQAAAAPMILAKMHQELQGQGIDAETTSEIIKDATATLAPQKIAAPKRSKRTNQKTAKKKPTAVGAT